MTAVPDERERIRAVTDRILAGTPQRSNGALTIVALAIEADVPRNALTQRHPDLKTEFYDKVRVRGQTPDSETRLRKQINKLKALRAGDVDELARLRTDRAGVERVVKPTHHREPAATHRTRRTRHTSPRVAHATTPDPNVKRFPNQGNQQGS
jgi:hypothetical protein